MFPHDAVPDGAPFAPHHLYVGLIVLALALAAVWDNQDADPIVTAGGLALTTFSFALVWPFYGAVGAAGTLLGLAAIGIGLVRERVFFGRKTMVAALTGLAVAADDALEHAFGIPTPLDVLFNRVLLPITLAIEKAV